MSHQDQTAEDIAGSLEFRVVIFTIAARNYLAHVELLHRSVTEWCPDAQFLCYVVDGYDSGDEIPMSLRGAVVDCRAIGIPHFERMAFQYDVIEFCTSLKPYAFQHAFHSLGAGVVVYLDPDIRVYSDLNWLWSTAGSRSVALTPHVLDMALNSPEATHVSAAIPASSFLRVGSFNLGFILVRNDEAGNRFLKWWCAVLANGCYIDACRSLFVDQKWVDLAPALLGDDLSVVRDPGANVAYWNLHERPLREADRTVLGSPLRFVHFSSIDVVESNAISKNLKGRDIDLETYPAYRLLFEQYKRDLTEAGHEDRKLSVRYRFNYFGDGSPVTALHRRLFARLSDEAPLARPFAVDGPYYRWLLLNGLTLRPDSPTEVQARNFKNVPRKRKVLETIFRVLFRVLGMRYYLALLKELGRLSQLESNTFLLKRAPVADDGVPAPTMTSK